MDANKRAYLDLFSGTNDAGISKHAAALAFAVDVRKFEIDLYWKRAAYFWAFAAVALGAYLAALGSKDVVNKPQLLLLVSCVGLVFSVAWYLVNRASKFWQLNWEYHVDLLEDEYMGPIYKTVLHEHTPFWRVAGPFPISASKINQLLSLFVVAIFGTLLVATFKKYFQFGSPEAFPTGCLSFTGLALMLFFTAARVSSREGDKHQARPTVIQRDTRVVNFGAAPSALRETSASESGIERPDL